MEARRNHPARQIMVLGAAMVVAIGFCRFAYALVLPYMRESSGWSYSQAGLMNTVNLGGYLLGALGAKRLLRIGLVNALAVGAIACVLSLVVSSLSSHLLVFGAARLVSGVAAAAVLISGSALALNIAQPYPDRSAFYMSLFYLGPAFGILISGLIAPFILSWKGPGSWWIVWAALAGASAVCVALLPFAHVAEPPHTVTAADGRVEVRTWVPYLVGYFLFGAGYISYMTFMIAFVRDGGGSAAQQSGFWAVLAVGAISHPWVWKRVLATSRSGRGTAVMIAISALASMVPLIGRSTLLLSISAFVFGNTSFAVVTSTSAFARINFARALWPQAIAMLTVAVSIGQVIGPTATGAIGDLTGHLSATIYVATGLLVLGAIAAALQPEPKRA